MLDLSKIEDFSLGNTRADKILLRVITEGSVVEQALKEIQDFDEYTFGHCVRVGKLAIELGIDYMFDDCKLYLLGVAGVLHDYGKVKLDRELICKPSKLTKAEYKVVQRHVLYSCIKLEELALPKEVVRIVGEHHERKDGSGYPFGIASRGISLQGRILAAADMFDALSVKRVYQSCALCNEEAFEILRNARGVDRDVILELVGIRG